MLRQQNYLVRFEKKNHGLLKIDFKSFNHKAYKVNKGLRVNVSVLSRFFGTEAKYTIQLIL